MDEVYTTTRDPQSSAPGDTRWQPRAPDPELEAEFLRRLMVRLGAQDEQARTLTAARRAPSRSAPRSRKGVDGAELLQVHEPFDRAWRRVGLALDRVGFTVEDRDRAEGHVLRALRRSRGREGHARLPRRAGSRATPR